MPRKPEPRIDPKVMVSLSQMTSIAELIYSDDSSYEKFRCPKEDEKTSELDEGMRFLCEYIELFIGAEPTIHASKDEYCIYSALSRGRYYCMDNSGKMVEIKINPSDNGYCNGINFSCPPRE